VPVEQDVEALRGAHGELRPHAPQGARDDLQVPAAVVGLLGGEEGQVEVPEVVEHGAAAAPPAGQGDARPPHGRQVALAPRVLVAPDDHGRAVAPQQQEAAALQVHVGVDPVLQSQVQEHVGGPGPQDLPSGGGEGEGGGGGGGGGRAGLMAS